MTSQHMLVVGDPIEGIKLYAVDGPDDPRIEQNFANETWWVVGVEQIGDDDPRDQVLWSVTAADADEFAQRTVTAEELARLGKAIGYSSIPEALQEVCAAVLGYPPDDDDEEERAHA